MDGLNLVEKVLEANKAHQARGNVQLSYWCKLFLDFTHSPKELYAAIVGNLQTQRVPLLETNLVLIPEGGPFSPERLYVQIRRERLVFEICAAPFGNGFFVSSRLFDRRKEPGLLDYFAVLLVLLFVPAPFAVFEFGWVWGVIAVTGEIALVWTLLRLAAAGLLGSVDRVLSDVPFIGPLYDRYFHPDTYYRQDLNNSYREAVHAAVMQAVDGMVAQKGLKPLTPDERRPVVGGPRAS